LNATQSPAQITAGSPTIAAMGGRLAVMNAQSAKDEVFPFTTSVAVAVMVPFNVPV
jgi:hypothetical protein